jgi:hypothetical protein
MLSMTNRRELLQAGVAAATLPLVAGGIFKPEAAAATAGPLDVRVYKAIFDERYAECRAFGEQVSKNGVAARAIADGDVTSFWFDELDLLWRETPVAIAGLTQFGPMFVLERLGRERGLQVALRVEHQPRADGLLRHVMSGPPETLSLAARLSSGGMAWPMVMAGAVAGCRAGCSAPAVETLAITGAKPEIGGGTLSSTRDNRPERIIHYYMTQSHSEGHDLPLDGPLFSWVIAPKVGATRTRT